MNSPTKENLLLWVDIETTGLEPALDVILEIGFRVTFLDLRPYLKNTVTIHYDHMDDLYAAASTIVQDMHDKNHLWEDCKKSTISIAQAEAKLGSWIDQHNLRGMPLCGSSLRTDREFLAYHTPVLHDLFHYRSIDNSSTKELCRRYNPQLFEKFNEPKPNHRVQSCLDGSIAEFQFYLDNFLMQADDF